MWSSGFLNCWPREVVIFIEIEACSFATTIVSFQLQVKFIDSTRSTHLGTQEPYKSDERRPLEDATFLASLFPY